VDRVAALWGATTFECLTTLHYRSAPRERKLNERSGTFTPARKQVLALGAAGDALLPPRGAMRSPTSLRLFDELEQLAMRGGERDSASLSHFQHNVAELRELPGVTGPFRAKMASADGWAALLFSSWRHLKYNRPEISGADRVRAFIRAILSTRAGCGRSMLNRRSSL